VASVQDGVEAVLAQGDLGLPERPGQKGMPSRLARGAASEDKQGGRPARRTGRLLDFRQGDPVHSMPCPDDGCWDSLQAAAAVNCSFWDGQGSSISAISGTFRWGMTRLDGSIPCVQYVRLR